MSGNIHFGEFEIKAMNALLHEAEKDPLLGGFVFPDDPNKARLPIFLGNALVGFASPRQEKDGAWRMGAIFVRPEHRNKGIARAAIAAFMNGKKGRAFIESENIASQKAYEAAGFKATREVKDKGGFWWENF